MPSKLYRLSNPRMRTTLSSNNTNHKPGVSNKSHMKSLPHDLVAEIFTHLASDSLTNLIIAKQCCKDFYNIGNDAYVLQKASMDIFPVAPWPKTEKASLFLERCRNSGNAEAMFKWGMYEYFSLVKDSGLELLKGATEKGHVEATYVYGILLLFSGCEDKKQLAKTILSSLNNSEKFKVGECRKRVKNIISELRICNNSIVDFQHPRCNCWNDCNRGWDADDYGVTCSEECLWVREATLFQDLIRNKRW